MALHHIKLNRQAAQAICRGIHYFRAKKDAKLLQSQIDELSQETQNDNEIFGDKKLFQLMEEQNKNNTTKSFSRGFQSQVQNIYHELEKSENGPNKWSSRSSHSNSSHSSHSDHHRTPQNMCSQDSSRRNCDESHQLRHRNRMKKQRIVEKLLRQAHHNQESAFKKMKGSLRNFKNENQELNRLQQNNGRKS